MELNIQTLYRKKHAAIFILWNFSVCTSTNQTPNTPPPRLPPGGPSPYPFINHFWQRRYPFPIPSSDKQCLFHIPSLEPCIPFSHRKWTVFFFIRINQENLHPQNTSVSPFLALLDIEMTGFPTLFWRGLLVYRQLPFPTLWVHLATFLNASQNSLKLSENYVPILPFDVTLNWPLESPMPFPHCLNYLQQQNNLEWPREDHKLAQKAWERLLGTW